MDEKKQVKKIKLRSLIKEFFSEDLYYELRVVSMRDINNNEKQNINKEILKKYNVDFESLGTGTNRMAVLIDGYAFKIALDSDGMIDNQREFLYSDKLQPFVIKVYETLPDGLIAVSEYVEIFQGGDQIIYRNEMAKILEEVTGKFFVGDVGINDKNYGNWGKRVDGTICMLDFAYIYNVTFKLFVCACDGESMLFYDDNYEKLICPRCGRKYSFGEIRQRVTKKKQKEEIGDVRRLGYNISHSIEEVPENREFAPKIVNEKVKKEKSFIQMAIERHKKESKKSNKQDWDNPDQSCQ